MSIPEDAVEAADLDVDDPQLKLNEPWCIGEGEGALPVMNRWYAQPMETNDSPRGVPSKFTYAAYRNIARGKYGIVEIADTAIQTFPDEPQRVHLARYHQLILSESQEHLEGIANLAKHIREQSPFGERQVVAIQLDVIGPQSSPRFSDVFRTYEVRRGDIDPAAGSLLSDADVEPIIEAFVSAARLAYRAGINMVDVKCCHGYGLSRFLRPANIDRENWTHGGSFERRLGVVEEVIRRIKSAVDDPKFKLMIRFSAFEGEDHPGGIGTTGPTSRELDLSESRKMVQRFVLAGADVINLSAGTVFTWPWLAPSRPRLKVAPKLRLKPKDPWFQRVQWTGSYPLHHLRFAEEATEALGEIGRGDVPVVASGFSAFGEHRVALAEHCVRTGIAMAGVGRHTLAGSSNEPSQMCRTCDMCFPPLGPDLQSMAGCVHRGPLAELYALNVSARSRAKTAALRGQFDRLVNHAAEVIGKHLKADCEIEQYSRSLIVKHLFLGCCDALMETIEDGQKTIAQGQEATTNADVQRLSDRFRVARNAYALLQSRSRENDDARGLALMAAAVDKQISDVIRTLESPDPHQNDGRPDAQRILGLLPRISAVVDAYRNWSLYPQFRPSMVEESPQPGNIEGLAVNREALGKVPRHRFFVSQVLS